MLRSKDIITEAYCVELEEIVDIFDAHHEFFAQKEPRKRFSFLCSDEHCLQLNVPPKITGANYDKSDGEGRVAPHFRINANYVHSDECMWHMYADALSEIYAEKAKHANSSRKNLLVDFERIESSQVIDEFCIHKKPKEKSFSMLSTKNISRNDIKQRILNTPRKTSKLYKVVNQFLSMSIEERKQAQIKIFANPQTAWNNVFKKIEWIKSMQSWFHIYYGSAKVYKYRDGFRIFFIAKTKFYGDENIFDVTCFLPHSKLQEEKVPKSTIDALEFSAATKKVVTCYVLGKAVQRQEQLRENQTRNCVVILQESLKDIVVNEKSIHRV